MHEPLRWRRLQPGFSPQGAEPRLVDLQFVRHQAPLEHGLDLRAAVWQGQAFWGRLEPGSGQTDRWMANRRHPVFPQRTALTVSQQTGLLSTRTGNWPDRLP